MTSEHHDKALAIVRAWKQEQGFPLLSPDACRDLAAQIACALGEGGTRGDSPPTKTTAEQTTVRLIRHAESYEVRVSRFYYFDDNPGRATITGRPAPDTALAAAHAFARAQRKEVQHYVDS
ncbi:MULTISPECIES: hypothetical protein [unclassified Bradyrhizobium]|uniref:hypothetical protein n=1 Tax=unclassified Bradyrhizobium TaxID=2631580 RepID=UPI0028EB08F8|nr:MULTISPECIES: hypothetical protein [unclassified Bradyrhizobium]